MGKKWGHWTVVSVADQNLQQSFRHEVSYENDQLNGRYQKFDASTNVLLNQGAYDHGLKNGIWNEYFPDEKERINSQIAYVRGKYNLAKVFNYDRKMYLYAKYIDGNISLLEHFDTVKNKVDVRIEKIQFNEGVYDFDYSGIEDSTVHFHLVLELGSSKPENDPLFFYSYINLLLEAAPDKIYVDGPFKRKGKKGELIEEGFLKKGQRQGEWKYYVREQNVIKHVHFESGEKTTERYTTIESSKPFSGKFIMKTPIEGGYQSIKVKKGLRHGYTLIYDRQGKLVQKIKYKAGVKDDLKLD